MNPLPAHATLLFQEARAASQRAYAPYSKFPVGAAILMSDGSIVTGVNVENASFGLTICAERTAVFRAITEGKRDWQAIAIVSPTGVSPCGACRQVLTEFAPHLEVWYGCLDPDKPVAGPLVLSQLLPAAMQLD